MDEDLRGLPDDQKLNHLLENQAAMFKLFASLTRKNRERKCCGCHCVRERVRVSPKPSLGRENCISSLGGEFRETGKELG